jgi:hypothetical protein
LGELGDLLELIVVGPAALPPLYAHVHNILPGGTATEYEVWWAGEDRFRLETAELPTGGTGIWVRNGSRWWHRRDDQVVTNAVGDSNAAGDKPHELNLLVWGGRWLVVDPTARVAGRASIADRQAILVETDRRAVAVDAEHGVLLQAAIDGRLHWEVTEIAFDVAISAEQLEYTIPAGARVVPPSAERYELISASEAACRVDWPVFVPGPVPLSWPLELQHWPPRRDRPEAMILRLESPVWIHQSAAPDPLSFGMRFNDPDEWTQIEREEQQLQVRSAPNVVRLVRSGVQIEVYCLNEAGQASLEQLIAVALSLRPASIE